MVVQARRLGGRLLPYLSILSTPPISVRKLRNFLLDAFLSLRQIARLLLESVIAIFAPLFFETRQAVR
jgi:hypothetical protein